MVIENKTIEFDRVCVRDALTIKNAMMVMSKDNVSSNDMMDALKVIDDISIKYLKINGQKIGTIQALENIFDNEFSILQISTLIFS